MATDLPSYVDFLACFYITGIFHGQQRQKMYSYAIYSLCHLELAPRQLIL